MIPNNAQYMSNDPYNPQGNHIMLWNYMIPHEISCLALSRLGDKIAVGSENQMLYYFDRDMQLQWEANAGAPVHAIHMTLDGEFLVVGTALDVLCFSQTGQLLWTVRIGKPVTHIKVSPTGSIVVAGAKDRKIHVFNGSGGLINQFRTDKETAALEMTPSGNLFVTASDSTIYLVDGFGQQKWSYKAQFPIQSLGIADTGTFIIVGAMNSIYSIDITNRIQWRKTGKTVSDCISISPGGDVIMIGSRDGNLYCYNNSGNLLWNYKTGGVSGSGPKGGKTAGKLGMPSALLAQAAAKGVTDVVYTRLGDFIVAGAVNQHFYFMNKQQALLWKFLANFPVSQVKASYLGETMAVTAGNIVYLFENLIVYPLFLQYTQNLMLESQQMGLSVAQSEELLAQAAGAMNTNNIFEAAPLIRQARFMLLGEQKNLVLSFAGDVQSQLTTSGQSGGQIAPAQHMFFQGQQLYNQGMYAGAYTLFKQAIQSLSQPPQQAPAPTPAPTPSSAAPVPSSRPAQTPPPTRPMSSGGNGAGLNDHALKHEALSEIDTCTTLITNARSSGKSITSMELLMLEANESFDKGNYAKTLDLARRIKDGLSSDAAAPSAEGQKVMDMIADTRMIARQVEGSGVSVDTIEDELVQAEQLLARNGDASKAELIVQSAMRRLQEMKDKHQGLMREFGVIEGRIADLRDEGVDTHEAESLLTEAQLALDSGAEKRASGYLDKVRRILP